MTFVLLVLVLFNLMSCVKRALAFTTYRGFGPYRSVTRRYLTTNILIVGKKTAGEAWIAEGCQDYEKRLRPTMTVGTKFLKTDEELIKAVSAIQEKKGLVMALDELGTQYSSRDFSKLVFDSLVEGGSQLSLVIGGAPGLPKELRASLPLISLSKMTWTHQHARLLVYEQLYRAAEIHKGSKYHKD